jgi:KDO2-lipid IV(A) lauroyltransferase
MVDFFRMPLLTPEKLSSIIEFDEAHIPVTGNKGQGALLMTAHIGNWELCVPVLVKLGYRIIIIMVPQRGPGGSFIQSIRNSTGGKYISKRTSTRTMLRLLKDGNSLALLGDQDGRKSGAWVNFFAQSSSRPRGAAVFAIHTGAPLVATWCILQNDYRYRMEFCQIPTDNLPPEREQAVQELTQRYIAAVEDVVRQYPEQYFWFHRMWKTKPKD